ncbi:MAG: hypothetical protein H7336_05045 [Bacteriovorax sp.]|nr:hypothetical protein [Bacteriovorax sp.]
MGGGQLEENGVRRNKVEEPLTTGTLYPIQWRELRVNLAELAKLRFIDGWSRQQLADHYQRTLYDITYYYQNIRKKDFDLQGLKKQELERTDGHTKINFSFSDSGSSCGLYRTANKSIKG